MNPLQNGNITNNVRLEWHQYTGYTWSSQHPDLEVILKCVLLCFIILSVLFYFHPITDTLFWIGVIYDMAYSCEYMFYAFKYVQFTSKGHTWVHGYVWTRVRRGSLLCANIVIIKQECQNRSLTKSPVSAKCALFVETVL